MNRILIFVTVIGLTAANIGPTVAQPPPPYPPVPPPRHEAMPPPPPGGRYIWVPGHWQWNGYRYAWIGGRYDVRQPGWGHYVSGRWVWHAGAGRWVWRPAHWE